jgi:hypothetical protein
MSVRARIRATIASSAHARLNLPKLLAVATMMRLRRPEGSIPENVAAAGTIDTMFDLHHVTVFPGNVRMS